MMSLFSLIGVLGACACVGSSPILSHDVNDVAIVENNKVQPKLAEYDDESYEIIISSEELSNYTFRNLADIDNINMIGTVWYMGDDYSIEDTDNSPNPGVGAKFVIGSHTIYFNYNVGFEYRWQYGESTDFGTVPITLRLSSTNYSVVKNAIELDIQANQGDINTGIFQTLTDSIVSFVGSLGTGIVAMTDVFYDSVNQQLTAIGLLSVIVVAVSLTYFLFRLIIGLIRMRG